MDQLKINRHESTWIEPCGTTVELWFICYDLVILSYGLLFHFNTAHSPTQFLSIAKSQILPNTVTVHHSILTHSIRDLFFLPLYLDLYFQ
jgi:hypothetical protein